ncbi:MAG: hypothetical protein IJ468_01435 [Lachnospiraceae bacterium]|nr:hypothetical protein [Lachnospiraceae bacterium]
MNNEEFTNENFSAEKLDSLYEGVAEKEHENVITGILGAFVLSLAGAALYFAIYQFGYIAGICGLVSFMLAYWGYQKCSGKTGSMKGIVISIILTIITLFLAEFLCLTYEIYSVYTGEYGIEITLLDALKATPDFLTDPEVLPAVLKDLAVSYFLCILACGSTVTTTIKGQKNAGK